MTKPVYAAASTALLIVDPYNDFLAEGGKIWPRVEAVAAEVGLIANLKAVAAAARRSAIQIVFVPHRRWQPGDFEDWEYPNPTQRAIMHRHSFAKGQWGGDWYPDLAPRPGDLIVQEHWAQSGFANTDLDQQLRQRSISHVIAIGLLANTCIESTARYAMEIGYHVTLVRDATAAFSKEMMHAAHELNGPTYAHAILTTDELIAALPS